MGSASASASASAVPNGLLRHSPQLYSSIPWFSPATRTRSWFLSAAVTPSLYAESRRCRYSPVSCSGRPERGDDLSAAGDSRSVSGLNNEIKNPLKVQSSQYLDNKEKKNVAMEGFTSSIRTVALCVSAAVAFGVGVGLISGFGKASEFFAGYILEQSLSVDNLFVFVLVFKYFKVPVEYQNQVLSYGIAGAIIFRLSLILLGAATLQRFEAVNLLLAAILLYSSFKLFTSEEDDSDLSDNFIVKTCQKFIPVTSSYCGDQFITKQNGVWKFMAGSVFMSDGILLCTSQATPLLLTVAVIELSDIAFAVDSIPAVFGVTRDPFIVFSSNLFAILGLRSLYRLISEGMSDLEYLQPSIGVVLGFVGFKMILDYFGIHVSTEASLGVVATCLSAGVLLSLLKKSE